MHKCTNWGKYYSICGYSDNIMYAMHLILINLCIYGCIISILDALHTLCYHYQPTKRWSFVSVWVCWNLVDCFGSGGVVCYVILKCLCDMVVTNDCYCCVCHCCASKMLFLWILLVILVNQRAFKWYTYRIFDYIQLLLDHEWNLLLDWIQIYSAIDKYPQCKTK